MAEAASLKPFEGLEYQTLHESQGRLLELYDKQLVELKKIMSATNALVH